MHRAFLFRLCRRCPTTTGNCLSSRLVEDGNKRQQLFFSFPKLWRSPLEFNSTPKTFATNLTRWNKRDKVWGSANSLFKWRFRSRRLRRYVNSLFFPATHDHWFCSVSSFLFLIKMLICPCSLNLPRLLSKRSRTFEELSCVLMIIDEIAKLSFIGIAGDS